MVLLLAQVTDAQKGKTLLIVGQMEALGRLMMCVDEVILLATSSGQERARKIMVGICTPVVSPELIRNRGAYVEVEMGERTSRDSVCGGTATDLGKMEE